jgi:hypothetical protein
MYVNLVENLFISYELIINKDKERAIVKNSFSQSHFILASWHDDKEQE